MICPKLRFKEFNDSWKNYQIKDIAKVIGGGTPDTSNSLFWNGDINWFTPSEIGKSKYVCNSIRKITDAGLKQSSAKLLPVGSILLTSRATIGESSILIDNLACTNQGFQSLVVNSNNNSEFVYYLTKTIKKQMLKKSFGSTFLEISKSNLEKIKVNIPKKAEQDKIAKFFSALDNKLELQACKIDELIKLKKWLNNHLYIPNNTWKKVKLGDVLVG